VMTTHCDFTTSLLDDPPSANRDGDAGEAFVTEKAGGGIGPAAKLLAEKG
jgi:hypothetical protein